MNGQTINELQLHDFSTRIVTLSGNRADIWYRYRASFGAGNHKVFV